MYCLMDCNNFYANCERLFRPDLRRRPVAVLSNNDGCVIAMSNEVKKLGVRLGTPHFQCRKMLQNAGAAIFSANFPLYGDISARVMDCLRRQVMQVEVYSIDEAFFAVDQKDLDHSLRELSKLISRWTGIPVSIGAAPTKTLAKLANRTAKHTGQGTVVLTDVAAIRKALANCEIDDIWGIGYKIAKRLRNRRIDTALDFYRLDPDWVKRHMGVAGLRTWQELKGKPCLVFQKRQAPGSICHSRTFARRITDQVQLLNAIRMFAACTAERLRQERLLARRVRVTLGLARRGSVKYRNLSAWGKLATVTCDSWKIMDLAEKLVRELGRPDRPYARAGVTLLDFTDVNQQELELPELRADRSALLEQIDRLNRRYGKNTVLLGNHDYRPKQDHLSPRYTTCQDDICPVN